MSHEVTRRRFVASTLAAAACRTSGSASPDPSAPVTEPAAGEVPAPTAATPYPFVCGLSFLPDDPALFQTAGLSGLIADVSDGEMRTREHVVVPELNDAGRLFTLHDALGAAGFTAAQVEKIMGGNWTRVLSEAL